MLLTLPAGWTKGPLKSCKDLGLVWQIQYFIKSPAEAPDRAILPTALSCPGKKLCISKEKLMGAQALTVTGRRSPRSWGSCHSMKLSAASPGFQCEGPWQWHGAIWWTLCVVHTSGLRFVPKNLHQVVPLQLRGLQEQSILILTWRVVARYWRKLEFRTQSSLPVDNKKLKTINRTKI